MKRPFGVTFLALIMVFAAVGNGLRLSEAVFFWKIFEEYSVYPLYITISGGFWFLAGLSITWGLWQRKTWAWFAALGGAVGYGSWYWFDRLVFQEPHSNWPFALVSTVFFVSCFSIMIHRSVIKFFFQNSPSITHLFQSRVNGTRIAPNEKKK
jgi:hypothetical protein